MNRASVVRNVRGVLVAGHLVAIGLAAIPSPDSGMSREAWREPTVQAEFRAWSARLGVPQERFEATLWRAATAYSAARERANRPFARYLDWTGALQPWTMFAGPNLVPSSYEVLVLAQGAPDFAWETLYRSDSPAHAWHAAFFAHERVRSMLSRYSWPMYSWGPPAMCRYLAGEVFRERASAAFVRCRFSRAPTPTPEEARAGVVHPRAVTNELTIRRPR